MTDVMNHCALCGKEIEPEEEFCDDCAVKVKDMDPCPDCGKIICECEAGTGD